MSTPDMWTTTRIAADGTFVCPAFALFALLFRIPFGNQEAGHA